MNKHHFILQLRRSISLVHRLDQVPTQKKSKALHSWDELEAKLKAGAYSVTTRLNVEIDRITVWQIFIAQCDRLHLIYTHNIRFKRCGEAAAPDKEMDQFIQKRWIEHSRHPLVTGLKSTGAAPSATAAALAAAATPLVHPPLGLDTSLLFTLH